MSKLTNGVYIRVSDGITQNLFNIRENSGLAVEAAGDLTYATRSGGGGAYGTRARVTFNGPEKRGVVIRLHPSTTDSIKAVVRDNLSTLTYFRVQVQGQIAIE